MHGLLIPLKLQKVIPILFFKSFLQHLAIFSNLSVSEITIREHESKKIAIIVFSICYIVKKNSLTSVVS